MGLFSKTQTSKIKVDKGYQPSTVTFKQGKPAQIIFNRTTPSSCLERVHSDSLNFDQVLPLNEKVTVDIDTSQVGEFEFACGMDMFKGKVVVK